MYRKKVSVYGWDSDNLLPVKFALDSNGFLKNSIDNEPQINYAIKRISETYSDTVSVYSKAKELLKYGRNPNLTTSRGTIWYTGQDQVNETYVATNTNSIDTISSSDSGDTQDVVVEGHTESGGNKTFVVQTATLNGQNKVTLTTPLNRLTRLYNNDSTDFAGDVYGYEDTAISSGKPTDTTKIHITVNGTNGHNQSEKASTSLSSQDYWIITTFRASVIDKVSSTADVELQVRAPGGVFREVEDVTASNQSPGVIKFDPYYIVPPNYDVRLQGVSSAVGGVEISGSVFGYLAIVI